jgi:RNA recognition motif
MTGTLGPGGELPGRKHLANVRVIQRNLVYITNLAVSLAKEEILRQSEYFGQYGKIIKVVINKNNLYNTNHPQGPSVSAYLTFSRGDDARRAIETVDGYWVEGRALRASFGTTKYCSYFLRNVSCTNPDCMYLHALGGTDDSFTKEDMASNRKTVFHDQTHPHESDEEDEAMMEQLNEQNHVREEEHYSPQQEEVCFVVCLLVVSCLCGSTSLSLSLSLEFSNSRTVVCSKARLLIILFLSLCPLLLLSVLSFFRVSPSQRCSPQDHRRGQRKKRRSSLRRRTHI